MWGLPPIVFPGHFSRTQVVPHFPRRLNSHVNLIPYNPVDDAEFVRPSRNRTFAFANALKAGGCPASIRVTRGLEASAACGQLRNTFVKNRLAADGVAAEGLVEGVRPPAAAI